MRPASTTPAAPPSSSSRRSRSATRPTASQRRRRRRHLALAGRQDTLFSDDAVALLHQTSRGIPRALNNLATQALVAAYAARKAIVDESAARAAITEVTAE